MDNYIHVFPFLQFDLLSIARY